MAEHLFQNMRPTRWKAQPSFRKTQPSFWNTRPGFWNTRMSFRGLKRKLKAWPRVCVITRSQSATVIDTFWSCRLFKGVLKNLQNVQEKLSYGVPFRELQVFKLQSPALSCMFLKFWNISEITRALKFLFTEAGTSRLSTE